MTVQDLMELESAMHKVLCRLRVLQVDLAGRPICREIDDEWLKDQLLLLTSNEDELSLFKFELEELAEEMLVLRDRDVQFHS